MKHKTLSIELLFTTVHMLSLSPLLSSFMPVCGVKLFKKVIFRGSGCGTVGRAVGYIRRKWSTVRIQSSAFLCTLGSIEKSKIKIKRDREWAIFSEDDFALGHILSRSVTNS